MKATEQCFPVVLFIKLYKVVPTFFKKSVFVESAIDEHKTVCFRACLPSKMPYHISIVTTPRERFRPQLVQCIV